MDRIYDYASGKLIAQYRDMVTFNLELRSPITQVCGESATGKTLLAKLIKNEKRNNKFNNDYVNDLSNIEVFDDTFSVDDLLKIKNSLIIIDRCDLILTKEITDFIKSDRNNHYLLFARTALSLGISPNYYGEFVCDDNNTITVLYRFSEAGWF